MTAPQLDDEPDDALEKRKLAQQAERQARRSLDKKHAALDEPDAALEKRKLAQQAERHARRAQQEERQARRAQQAERQARRREFKEREARLTRELKEREAALDEHEKELASEIDKQLARFHKRDAEFTNEVYKQQAALDKRDAELTKLANKLAKREAALDNREAEFADRFRKLDLSTVDGLTNQPSVYATAMAHIPGEGAEGSAPQETSGGDIMVMAATRLEAADVGEAAVQANELDQLQKGNESSSRVVELGTHGRHKRTITSWKKAGRYLGRGSFGLVFEAISYDGSFFAVKEVSLDDQGLDTEKQRILLLEHEISLLCHLEHENIVQYIGTDKKDGNLYILFELVTQGSLVAIYQKYQLQDSHVSAYTRQILNGLQYLHQHNILHRDIKCANILVDASGLVKLADFGLAKVMPSETNSIKGTVFWMAPEVAKKKRYGTPADIWSLGCTVLEMLTRKVPYYVDDLDDDTQWVQAVYKIGKGELPEIPSTLSEDAQDFIKRCLQTDPNDRPSAAQLLEHPFVQRPLQHQGA